MRKRAIANSCWDHALSQYRTPSYSTIRYLSTAPPNVPRRQLRARKQRDTICEYRTSRSIVVGS
eukprot:969234-Rhodomonas_salina.2